MLKKIHTWWGVLFFYFLIYRCISKNVISWKNSLFLVTYFKNWTFIYFRFIECNCSQSAVSKHIKCKLTGRKKLDRKRCTSNRDDRKLENTVKQSRFKHLGELEKERTVAGVSIKSHHTQTSSGKELPSHFWNRNIVRSILPGLKRKRTGLLPSGPKSFFQIKVNVEGTESNLLEVQCEVFEVSDDLGCCDVCWCWSTVFYQVQSQCSRLPGDFGELYASICWQALWRCWFIFPVGL